MTATPAFWAVIPAAGVGRRMGSAIPKQYLELAGRPVIEHTLECFIDHPAIVGVVVAVDPADPYWPETRYATHPRVIRAPGGAERCNSVLNGLEALSAHAAADDWALVHDAARPCLRRSDLDAMLDELADDPVGGILAVQVRDTMKRAGTEGRIETTVERSALWHAFTPQMFRLGTLRQALRQALAEGALVTDESSAIERLGQAPRLLEGQSDNLKITRPEDLALARFHLQQQGRLD
ncbi:2-C-methyl-D-erythritol 4-phosphate cytidylyltransferase [Marichromatium sp. AB32]|uniref:2-C-methyl-D-erythritol 4-phosphate cytidylyltransferase n=1 Tax=Marichromatium sp. AB32 TaxID=2483363 RepID=UPI000F3DD1C6|nr:2-C-methyl-D-erythritol 4-phosphate cytidylyltransferase [Marichromatium sp. AB32]RNE94029.1 2-C-methyl-D-erythritol 4-phosphate cytidylyltransferase [Marichromatium sp. AB32]